MSALSKLLVALLFSAITGVAFAGATNTTQQADPPVDCKKNPDDPKCSTKK